VAAVGALTGAAAGRFPAKRTEVIFAGPQGMKVSWCAPTPDGRTGFSATKLEAPGRYNFVQAAIYRLKLSDLPGRPGVELYPTLEVVPSNAKTDAFLAHSAVPLTFTAEDLDQVARGHYLVKVIYLPEPQYQDLAITGTDELSSARLEPGVNPIEEAHRRGSVLLVVRLGNIDLELANSPPLDAPPQSGGYHAMQMPAAMRPANATPTYSPAMMVAPNAPVMPPPVMTPPGSGPVSKLPEVSHLQTVQYQNPAPGPATPAQLAGQSTDSSSSAKKSTSTSWWKPGGQ
jgi:hypothetical protein